MLIKTFTLKCRCTLNVNPEEAHHDEYHIKNSGKRQGKFSSVGPVLSSLVRGIVWTKPFLSRACPDFHAWLIMHPHDTAHKTGPRKDTQSKVRICVRLFVEFILIFLKLRLLFIESFASNIKTWKWSQVCAKCTSKDACPKIDKDIKNSFTELR